VRAWEREREKKPRDKGRGKGREKAVYRDRGRGKGRKSPEIRGEGYLPPYIYVYIYISLSLSMHIHVWKQILIVLFEFCRFCFSQKIQRTWMTLKKCWLSSMSENATSPKNVELKTCIHVPVYESGHMRALERNAG